MLEKIDQIFVLFKDWLVGFLPAGWQGMAGVLLCVVAIIAVYPTLFALAVLMERKGLGRMQNRYGPNRVGPFGIFQPIADGVKSLTKEDIVPFRADAVVHFLAPVVLVVAVFMGSRSSHGPQHGAGEPGRQPALLLRDGRFDGVVGLHGGVVEPKQIFAAGRDARGGADDQLRGAAAAVEPGGGDDDRVAFAGEYRGGARSLHRHLSALVRVYALGICGLRDLRDRLDGRDKPFTLRFA